MAFHCQLQSWLSEGKGEGGGIGKRFSGQFRKSKVVNCLPQQACQALRRHYPSSSYSHLAVLITDTGAQPLVNDDETIVLAVNGEIYNHIALRKSLKNPAKFKTHSDCEVIMHLVCGGHLLFAPKTS